MAYVVIFVKFYQITNIPWYFALNIVPCMELNIYSYLRIHKLHLQLYKHMHAPLMNDMVKTQYMFLGLEGIL